MRLDQLWCSLTPVHLGVNDSNAYMSGDRGKWGVSAFIPINSQQLRKQHVAYSISALPIPALLMMRCVTVLSNM